MIDIPALKQHIYDVIGALLQNFATIERYFYDKDVGEVLTVEGRIARHL